ncbi:hypothetical protein WN48_03508 [Eufriesea mexicana]|uniref:Uncharacterized protein n=1 Tax=Eufriesea mexicana TaxID=516756 RepID=A0A310SPK0_9HYME|nr:hypothetical protein WN48_03508 [Eufriesea mexicana]
MNAICECEAKSNGDWCCFKVIEEYPGNFYLDSLNALKNCLFNYLLVELTEHYASGSSRFDLIRWGFELKELLSERSRRLLKLMNSLDSIEKIPIPIARILSVWRMLETLQNAFRNAGTAEPARCQLCRDQSAKGKRSEYLTP